MHNNRIWLIFLLLISITVLWYSAQAIPKFYTYSILTDTTQPKKVEWSVKDTGNGRYFLEGNYSFLANGELRSGKTQFLKPVLRYKAGADNLKEKFEEKKWVVWYAPKNSKQSTLQKVFPFKDLAYLLVLWGILIYYVRVGINVEKNRIG